MKTKNEKKSIFLDASSVRKIKRSENLTSTENGRSNIRTASDALKDDLLVDLDDEDIDSICYHLKACYKPYILRSKRAESTQETDSIDENAAELDETKFKTPGRSKRRKTDELKNPCIICNQITFKGDSNLHRICEEKRAKLFLCAIRLNLDEVYTRCSTYKTAEHIFAADIVSHKNCIKRYLLQYQRYAEEIINYDEPDDDSDIDVEEAFTTMLSQLHLETKGYTISACHDILNSKLEGYAISNRKVKQMLIKHFGEEICITYPKEKNKSQMFFSTKICPATLIETLRVSDPVKICAAKLRKECEDFDFLLENSYSDANDLQYSLNQYKENRPESWELFLNTLFPYRKKSIHIQRKCDNIFQIVFNLIHNGEKKTPMHVSFPRQSMKFAVQRN